MTIQTMLLKLLVAVAGDVLTTYIMPLISDPKRKGPLAMLAPIATHWVKIVEESSLKGEDKRKFAAEHIALQAKNQFKVDVPPAFIDTAIQLAYHAAGLDKK